MLDEGAGFGFRHTSLRVSAKYSKHPPGELFHSFELMGYPDGPVPRPGISPHRLFLYMCFELPRLVANPEGGDVGFAP